MTSVKRFDDVVIGAGILGLAHAYELARRGRRVAVFERSPRASGASVRNFGMLWPIGQPFGEQRGLAERSLQVWHEVLASSGLWHERSGSLHLAYRDDEAQVLSEFADLSHGHGAPVDLLSADQVREKSSAVKHDGLRLALWSAEETCVDPRQVVASLPEWLSRRFGVEFHFGQAITAVAPPEVIAGRRKVTASGVWICAGAELNALFADEFQKLDLVACKLQMMRSEPLDSRRRIGPMLAAGLTLRHYSSFRNCPSLPALCRRVARESPLYDRLGIHVLVSQTERGELTIGDSHEYGPSIEPFDKTEIDDAILDYLRTFLEIPVPRIASRWNGTYVKHLTQPYVITKIDETVTAITGVGGAGMTLSFGLAEHVVTRELGE